VLAIGKLGHWPVSTSQAYGHGLSTKLKLIARPNVPFGTGGFSFIFSCLKLKLNISLKRYFQFSDHINIHRPVGFA
tara:strand:+ start:3480 stop:3707 length:228 start_codon:yes stop_codon:yes gene_type:complete